MAQGDNLDGAETSRERKTTAGKTEDTSTEIQLPGDHLIPDAPMIYNRIHIINYSPAIVWPWIIQLGKNRGGWYLPHSIERWIPSHWRASRTIESKWQSLAVGDRIDDYGGKNEYFDVVSINAPHCLVYKSERFGTQFSWAILLAEKEEGKTEVCLRFRGRIKSRGWKRRVIVWGGDLLDWGSTASMLRGLAERVEGKFNNERKI